MIDGDKTREFTFGAPPGEEEPPGTGINEDLLHLRLKKINRRIILLTLFLPVLLVLMGIYGYLEIQKQLFQKEDSDIEAVEVLTQEVNERLGGFSERIDGIEEKLAQTLSTSQKQTSDAMKGLEQKLTAVQKAVKSIDVSGAVATVEKEQKAMMDSVNQTLKPLGQRIDALSEDVKTLDGRLSEQLAALSDQVGKNSSRVASVQKDTNALSQSQLNKEQLDLEMLKIKKANQIVLESEIGKLQRNLNLLSEDLERLESRLANELRSSGSGASGSPTGQIREQPLQ